MAKSCPALCDPRSVAHQALLSMGFLRQESWAGGHVLLQEISKGASWPRRRTCMSCAGRQILHQWATGEARLPTCPVITWQSRVCAARFLILFWLHHASCRILVPQAGIEPRPQQWKQRILTPGPPGNCSPTLRSSSDIPAFPGEMSKGTQFLRCYPQSTSICFRFGRHSV